MAEAPAADETLKSDDVSGILDELVEAQNHSKVLGVKLLPPHEVEAIHCQHQDPKERLLHILLAFTRQIQPRPTWRVIVEALRSPSVNLPSLAARVEAAHFPDPTSTHDAVPETTTDTTDLVANTTAGGDGVKSKPPPQLNPANITTVETEIKRLHERFNTLKDLAIQGLQKIGVAVLTVVYILTNIRTHEHRLFLKENHKALRQCEDHLELFGSLNFYWNYLAPDLLDHLIGELTKKHKAFNTSASEMTAYNKDLEEFKKRTTLVLFCEADPRPLDEDPPPGFRKMVVKFDWPQTATLEDVEKFRRRYASSYDLQTCAMMLNSIGTGSFTVTWFVPVSVVETLRKKRALSVFKEFSVTRLDIHTSTQICVYQIPPQRPVAPSSTSDSSPIAKSAANKSKEPGQVSSGDEDYPFVEEPSDDFFCPVTTGVLLHPHLTSCCGNHISEEAACRIQRERGACPLCKKKDWSTMFSKHFKRQVNSLRVFCHHEDRGCGWQGELAAFHPHVSSCPMRDGPPMTELLKLPLYREAETGAFPSLSGAISPHSSAFGTVLRVNKTQPPPLATAVPHALPPVVKPRKRTAKCHRKKAAPCGMVRGSATTDGRFAYFTPLGSNSVYQYECSTEKWEELSCPYENSGLVIINRELTAVGGVDGSRRTNKLYTLQKIKGVNKYPPMNTARSHTAVVKTSDGEYLIVIGGCACNDSDDWTATVELFQVRSRRWYKLTDLPQPLVYPSATLCGGQLNVIGTGANGYSCSLATLPSSDQPITSPLTLFWMPLPPLPVRESTAATLCGKLVLIGGRRGGSSSVNPIHKLVDGQWVKISSMTSGRYCCLVASTSPDKIIIVGGYDEFLLNSVEECVVV